ncbi:DnaJ domain-containing protein [Paenibacillus sp. UMB7766-LJ446]|uniref:J domain-containing protein n=1 Tax=Paenibacillus sp. UMB7766-LJ446 TaxID=3046313 RepID=UPI002550A28A|nr:J domain-containing protein [Paenibacillus sp. UMB7766-LJ446]MDK8191810.1 DnaJ domain-containing protein [Paenibacillus sp. UMB7766-LJ446]
MLLQYKGIESIPRIAKWYLKKNPALNYNLWVDNEITDSLINWIVDMFRDLKEDQIKDRLNFLFHHLTFVLLPQLEQSNNHHLYNQCTYHHMQLQISKLIYELKYGIKLEPYGEPEDVLGLKQFTDYYSILGIEQTAKSDDIKRAYRTKAKKEHPDVGGNEESFKLLLQAYETLMSVEQRANYDIKYQSYQNELTYDFFLSGFILNKLIHPEQTPRKAGFKIQFKWKAYLSVLSSVILILLCLKIFNLNSNTVSQTDQSAYQYDLQEQISVVDEDVEEPSQEAETDLYDYADPNELYSIDDEPSNTEYDSSASLSAIEPMIQNEEQAGSDNVKTVQSNPSESSFFLATSIDEIQSIMGTPTQVMNVGPLTTWYYGNSTISFTDGQVTGWNNRDNNLKLEQLPLTEGEKFFLETSLEDVKSAMGTPTQIMVVGPLSTWYYDNSTISFTNEKVTGWNDRSNNLNLEQSPLSEGNIFLGASLDEVKSVMGIPTQIMDIGPLSTWYYENSTISFSNDKVTGWNDRDKNLKLNP